MKEWLKNTDIVFWVAFMVSIGLIVGGFFVPPVGVIDGSVLTATGLLTGFVEIHHYIETGLKRKRLEFGKDE